MPISRGLVISLGTSVLGCTLLFLYFRNRISVIERKVDVMFDLIQNHNQQQQSVEYEEEPQNIQFSVREKQEVEHEEDSRIVVSDDEGSDDEDAFDSDDSEEVSDNEEEDVSLNLKDGENIEINDIKTITLDGPENVGDAVEVDSLDEIDDDEDDDNNEDNISTDKQEKKEEVQQEDEEEDEEEEEDGEEETVKEIDYSGLKVSELKSIAEERELNGYKSLKKSALINLLKANE